METERMKKFIWLCSIALLINLLLSSTLAAGVFEEYKKVIWIDQLKQVGAAYERGKKLQDFPVLTGDDETTTEPGIYLVRVKDEDYYSRKYQTPMPYSIFFNYEGKSAIHQGEVPPPREKIKVATHGCVHVERPIIEWLYEWTEVGRTAVVISGRRTQD
jgi:lipoprotein-anchoring transpeptidase ErfK/SrfK